MNSAQRAQGRRPKTFKLVDGDGQALAELMRGGWEPVRVVKRARVLQLSSEGKGVKETATAVGVADRTVRYIKERYAEGGLERALWEAPHGAPERALDERQEQEVVAMLCGPSPTGRARWTVRLATKEAIHRGIAATVGRETIRRLMHEHALKPWREKNVVHPEAHS
jgi:transposase